MAENIITVSQLNTYIKSIIEYDNILNSVWVKGEISNFKHHSSGHIYLTLKDESGVLKGVMFRTYAYNLNFTPEDGMKVLVHGRVSVYEQGGVYQLYIDKMEPDGVGALYIAFEQLKEKLAKEGLFDESRKKPLPKYPEKVGVITSPTGAAVRDIINVITRRYPLCDIIVYPVQVQGEGSAEQIEKALDYFSETKKADVLIVGRGGGSIEDLWEFNKEITARAIARCSLPVISAVGHETDFTIADFVSDMRAPTPSAGAELAVPSISEIRQDIFDFRYSLDYKVNSFFKLLRAKTDTLTEKVTFKGILRNLDNKRIYIDSVFQRIENEVKLHLHKAEKRLSENSAKLHSLSPLKVIARGYSLTRTEKGQVVTKTDDVSTGDTILLNVTDGVISAEVKETKPFKGDK